MSEPAAPLSAETLTELREQVKQIGSTASGAIGGFSGGQLAASAAGSGGFSAALGRLAAPGLLAGLQASVGNRAAARSVAGRAPVQRVGPDDNKDSSGGPAPAPGTDPNAGLPPGGLPEGHTPDPNAHASGGPPPGGAGTPPAGPPPGGTMPGGSPNGAPPPAATAAPKAPPAPGTVPVGPTPPGSAPPTSSGAPAAQAALDDRVADVMNQRKDPTKAQALSDTLAKIDTARLGSVSYSFTPSGLAHVLEQSVWPSDNVFEHARAGFTGNAYGNEGGFIEFVEGLRGVLRILGDIASAVAAVAGIVALIGAAFAWTGVGAAVMAVAADVAVVGTLVKMVTDLLDAIIGMILMAHDMRKLHESSNPAERARFAALVKKEAADTAAATVSFGIGLVTVVATAGIGAAASGEISSAKGWVKAALGGLAPGEKAFSTEAASVIREANDATGAALKGAARTAFLEAKYGVGMQFDMLAYMMAEAPRENILAAAKTALKVTGPAGIAMGVAGTEAQTQGKVAAGVGGAQPDNPAAPAATPAEPRGTDVSLAHVGVWPQGLEDISNQRSLIQAARTRMADWHEMALADASPEAKAAVEAVVGTVESKHTRHKAAASDSQSQADAANANLTRAQQQVAQAGDKSSNAKQQQDQMKAKAASAAGKLAAAPKEPPGLIERAMNWFGDKMGALTGWVQNKLMGWIADAEGLTPDERKMVGMKDDAEASKKTEEQTKKDAADAAAAADSTEKAVADLKSKASRRDQNAMQAVSDTTRFLDMLDGLDDELADQEDSWKAGISSLAPQLSHELDVSGKADQEAATIDAAYVDPIVSQAASTPTLTGNLVTMVQGQGDSSVTYVKGKVQAAKGDSEDAGTQVAAQVSSSVANLKAAAEQANSTASALSSQATAKIGTTDYPGVTELAQKLEDSLSQVSDAAATALADIGAAAISAVDLHTKKPATGQDAGDTPVPAAPPADPSGTGAPPPATPPGAPPAQVPASAVA